MNLEALNGNRGSEIAAPLKPDFTFPPIAGFWRRILAFIIDILIIGIFGQIITWPLSGFWFKVGPYGGIVGLFLLLVYFGLTYSKIFKGQSIGKRIVKIAVRGKDNNPISLGRSLLRASILAIPFMLNGWALPFLNVTAIKLMVGFIVFGVGAAIAYTMLFNQRSRQGIHDMICGTYVVHLGREPLEIFPLSSKKHWVVSGALIAVVIIIVSLVTANTSSIVSKLGLSELVQIQDVLQTDSRFFTVDVTKQTVQAIPGKDNLALEVSIWCKGEPSVEERSEIIDDVTQVVLQKIDANRFDTINIILKSGYDLGIADRWITYNEVHKTKDLIKRNISS
jgi:uncharacterized RDD family membrane protein YckC